MMDYTPYDIGYRHIQGEDELNEGFGTKPKHTP